MTSTILRPRAPDSGQAAEEPSPRRFALPIEARNASLAVLAVIAVVVFVHWAQAVFIPITFAILISYALTPVVDWLRRTARLPKAIGAALTLLLIMSGLGVGLNSLKPDALDVLDLVPRAAQKLTLALKSDPRTKPGAVAKMEKAANEIEKAANSATVSAAPAPARPAPDETSRFRVRDFIFVGTMGLVSGLGQVIVVIALVYFLLVAGDTFRRTLVQVSGDSLSGKKITVNMLDEIDSQIQRYLLVQIGTSALLGGVAWMLFTWIGVDNAATWSAVGGVLHLIPYAGPAAFVALTALVAYVQFDTLQPVVVLLAILVATLGVIGLLLVPWLTQKTGSLNAVTVFVALLAWGWLWGISGLLLGVPIMMAVKAVCERSEDLQPISAFLGHRPAKPPPQEAPAPLVDT